MTLVKKFNGWTRAIDEDWDKYVAKVSAATREEVAHDAILKLGNEISTKAVFVAPEKLAAVASVIAPVVERSVVEEEAEWTDALPIDVITVMNLGNAVECVGAVLSPATHKTIVGWIHRINAQRNDERAHWYWTKAFAALALGDRRIYRAFTGVDKELPLPFQAGQTFGFNMQGLARHLAGAIEEGAPAEAVMPAFNEFLENFDNHWRSESASHGTLLWIARIVYHRIGKESLGMVGTCVHAKIVEMAEVA